MGTSCYWAFNRKYTINSSLLGTELTYIKADSPPSSLSFFLILKYQVYLALIQNQLSFS